MNKHAESDEFELDFSSLLDFPPPATAVAAVDSLLSERKNPPQLPEGEKYVVFHLDDKLYAVHSAQVSEVIGSLAITPLPPVISDRAAWLAGVANLRGNIISVVDLRRLWKKPVSAASPSPRAKMLVMRSDKISAAGGGNKGGAAGAASSAATVAAFIVDKLSEMITLTPGEIKFSAADFESSFPTFFGRAERNSQTIFLLDAENLFSSLVING